MYCRYCFKKKSIKIGGAELILRPRIFIYIIIIFIECWLFVGFLPISSNKKDVPDFSETPILRWLREQDLNLRPSNSVREYQIHFNQYYRQTCKISLFPAFSHHQ